MTAFDYRTLSVKRDPDGVTELRLKRPEQKDAPSAAMIMALTGLAERLGSDEKCAWWRCWAPAMYFARGPILCGFGCLGNERFYAFMTRRALARTTRGVGRKFARLLPWSFLPAAARIV